MGIVAKDQGIFVQANNYFNLALDIVRKIGDKMGENILLGNQ